ncbi:high frequency lysogenization protein HflD [Spongorhabdus nitratireducens]
MPYSTEDQALALAGVFQATRLVEDIAHKGRFDEDDMAASLESLFQTSPDSVEAVYGNAANMRTGLRFVRDLLFKDAAVIKSDSLRYGLALLHLERKLAKRSDMMELIGRKLDAARTQREHFELMHENIIANLADIYLQSISTFGTRIHVVGERTHVENKANTARIRACLLAGIRSAMLWRQTGGSRWQLVWSRKKLGQAADRLLHS